MFGFLRRSKQNPEKRDAVCAKEMTVIPSNSSLDQNRYANRYTAERPPESPKNGYQQQTTKDVINLLIPEKGLEYGNQSSGISGFLQRMAGGRRKNKHRKNNSWNNNYKYHAPVRIENQKGQMEDNCKNLEDGPILDERLRNDSNEYDGRFNADLTPTHESEEGESDVRAQADFVRDLVLEKYKRARNKSAETSNENIDASDCLEHEKQPENIENLLIQCKINTPYNNEEIISECNDNTYRSSENYDADISNELDSLSVMGASDSRQLDDKNCTKRPEITPIPEIVLEVENKEEKNVEDEEEELFTDSEDDSEKKEEYAVPVPIKSNLKIPKYDMYPSDDDGSIKSNDSAKKKVTFKKTIDFDDGDTQTDDEMDSTFESLTSSSDDESSDGPDNDEMLGGEIVCVNKADFDESANVINSVSSDSSEKDEKTFDDIPTIVSEYNSCNTDLSASEVLRSDNDIAFDEESLEESSTDGSISDEEQRTDGVTEIDPDTNTRNLVNQEGRFQEQVSQLTELAASRSCEADSLRWKLDEAKRELEVKDAGAERLRAELASAYKEAELVRQRLKYLEEELSATRSRGADLAEQLATFEGSKDGASLSEVEQLRQRIKLLEERFIQLELEKKALLEEKKQQEARAEEAVAAVAACESRWRRAHEKARSEASERAERVLADCEWKMRELEKKARDADKKLTELKEKYDSQAVASDKAEPTTPNQISAELAQLRGLSHEQQRALRAASAKATAAEQREAALAQDLVRLRELIDRDRVKAAEIETKYKEELSSQEEKVRKRLEEQRRAMMTLNQNSLRLEIDRVRSQMEKDHLEKQRAALQQQKNEHERAVKCVERRLKEAQTRLENLKDVLAKKESQFEHELAEARSTADWDLLQLRHLLDRADIKYATSLDDMQNRHEREIEKLNEEWSLKLREAENASEVAAGEARKKLEKVERELVNERLDQINRLKDQHKKEMEEQWENFMFDKEHCLARMKTECRLEGEEDRIKREKDLAAEIKEMKADVVSKTHLITNLKDQLSSKERRFSVTDQELRDALGREETLRLQLIDLTDRSSRTEQDSKNSIDHLTKKCACLNKLFEEMRSRLETRDAAVAAERRNRQEDLDALRAEVSRLTARLAECGPPGDRTSADGCDSSEMKESDKSEVPEEFFEGIDQHHSKAIPREPRRKGGGGGGSGKCSRRRAKSVDLPAVQVPVRIRQFDSRRSAK